MFDLDKWSEIWATVKKHKLRTLLTCFGVFWGIFMLVVMLGASRGFENGVKSTLDIAANSVFFWSNKTSEPYKGLKPGRFIRFVNEDVDALRNEIPELGTIAPRNILEGSFSVTRKNKNASFEVFGDYPDWYKVKPMTILEGRFINDKDLNERRKVVVIGEQVQKELFAKGESPIGKYISIRGIYFQVVGTFRTKGRGEDIMQDAKTIYMPHKTMQTCFNQGNRIYWFAFLPKPGIASSVVEQRVKEVMAQRHFVAPNDLKAFGSANVEEQFNKIQGLFDGIAGFSWVVSIGTILSGIIGVSNIMLIVVKERTKEIGVRKALGATPMSIISLIIQESIVITAAAGYIGLLLGVGLVEGINQLLKAFNAEGEFFANPEVNLNVAITSLVMLVVVGALAGLIPATKAAGVNPVVALKDE
ncbi:MAG: ABC transporter permease [Microscillaceae bacterium]|jgi:putative ABC transport system permease protein|nr:ABC transporter permease [Microscillaceae bacterium]